MSADFEHCEYERLPQGIHKLTYRTVGREAVDAFFAHFEKIAAATPHGEVMPVLTDGRHLKQTQPISYLLNRTRIALKKLPHRPIFRIGIVSHDSSMVTIMDNMFRMMMRGRDKLRFFGGNQYDTAIEWLLDE
jgi:hypothetical protein